MFLIITGIKCSGYKRLVEHDIKICETMGFHPDNIEVINLNVLLNKRIKYRQNTEVPSSVKEFYNKTNKKEFNSMGLSKRVQSYVEFMMETYGGVSDKVYIINGATELYNQNKEFWEKLKRRDVAIEFCYGSSNGDMRDICIKRYHEMKHDETNSNPKYIEYIDNALIEFKAFIGLLKETKVPFNVYEVDSYTLDNSINKISL